MGARMDILHAFCSFTVVSIRYVNNNEFVSPPSDINQPLELESVLVQTSYSYLRQALYQDRVLRWPTGWSHEVETVWIRVSWLVVRSRSIPDFKQVSSDLGAIYIPWRQANIIQLLGCHLAVDFY